MYHTMAPVLVGRRWAVRSAPRRDLCWLACRANDFVVSRVCTRSYIARRGVGFGEAEVRSEHEFEYVRRLYQ